MIHTRIIKYIIFGSTCLFFKTIFNHFFYKYCQLILGCSFVHYLTRELDLDILCGNFKNCNFSYLHFSCSSKSLLPLTGHDYHAKFLIKITSIYKFSLSVCLFVFNKRQNGWTDRAQILYRTSNHPRQGLWKTRISKISLQNSIF